MKPGYYFCEHWKMHYHFFIGWKWADFTKHISKYYFYDRFPDREPVGHTLMLNLNDGRTRTFIWTRSKTDYPTIAHECLHATNWTLNRAGVVADFLNDEAQAYMMTNLMQQGLKRKYLTK